MSTTSPARRTLIEDHPWLAGFFGASHPLQSLATAGPLAAAMVWLGQGERLPMRLLAMAAGALYWTLVEYAMHRWFYHWRPRHRALRRLVESFHVYHHRHLADRSVWNAGPFLVFPLTVILTGPVALLLRDTAATATVMSGAVLAYYAYEWSHYLVHTRTFRRGPLAYLQGFHLHHHHGNARRCFGVTNPLWDLLFGTTAPRQVWVTRPRTGSGASS
jgi:sterol desaturase/sphingolipid hydroxylase (fatty acid hydroxylase superfamily)